MEIEEAALTGESVATLKDTAAITSPEVLLGDRVNMAFIASYLLAALFVVLGGTPFKPLVILFLNFLITVPVVIALGFDKPAPDLMEKKPRPLKQPILSPSQWIRIAFIGILTAIATVYLETTYETAGAATATTIGFVAFSLLSIVMGLSARSETATAFNRKFCMIETSCISMDWRCW